MTSSSVLAASLPVFVQQIKNVDTVMGQKIQLECEAEGKPKVDVAW